MLVSDASIWIDYINDVISEKTAILKGAIAAREVVVGDLIVTEVLQGIRDDAKYERVKALLCGLKYESLTDKELAIKAAENYRLLRRKGITIRKTIDVIIGTYCIERGYPVLHNDQDFASMEQYLGLQVVR